MINKTSKSLNYSDVLYSYFSDKDSICHDKAEFHFIMYVMSGKVIVTENNNKYEVKKGQCVFIRRDHRITFTKSVHKNEPFESVTLKFSRNTIREFYQKKHIDKSLKSIKPFKASIRVMNKSPYWDSLFLSFVPFFESETIPNSEFIEQKMQEGINLLLNLNVGFYPTLFDFAQPWKIDILDFLNENYTYNLSIREIASYTGRSLATFKRDFAKISNLTPQKWIIEKRLQMAYDLLKGKQNTVNDVCHIVGFKNRSHFSLAFKKHFGFSPIEIE